MNKKILIGLGIFIVLLLSGVWVYLFFNGSPESIPNIFGSLPDSEENTTTENNVDPTIPEDQPDISNEPTTNPELPKLRQLTTTPVAGFALISELASSSVATTTATSSAETTGETFSSEVWFAEKGTGHIYTIDLENTSRTRISNRTITDTYDAYFAPSGEYGVLISGEDVESTITILEFEQATSSIESLVVGETTVRGENFELIDDNYLMYTVREDQQSIGYALHLPTVTTQEVFTLPYIETAVAWGSNILGTHIVYPKPHSELLSYVYQVNNNVINRLPIEGYDLSLIYHDNQIVYSAVENFRESNIPSNRVFDMDTQTTKALPTNIRDEKCILKTRLICGGTIENNEISLSKWYRGEEQFSDALWEVNTLNGSSRMLVNIQRTGGRQVDIDRIESDEFFSAVVFSNRLDDNIWIYELQ